LKEVTANFSAKDIEREVQEYWRTHGTYQAVKEQHSIGKPFFFVDGPPYTTGQIHLGTAWNKILKDSILRYHRMNGKNVIDRAGYDMHGLPIEVKVEQKLGFVSKKDIETFGIEKFINECREFAVKNKELMDAQFENLGIWMDFPNAYQTIKPWYVERRGGRSRKRRRRECSNAGVPGRELVPPVRDGDRGRRGRILGRDRPLGLCEVPHQGKSRRVPRDLDDNALDAPRNVAVAVGKEFVYARVHAEKNGHEEFLWIAEDLVKSVLKKGRYQKFDVLETKKGAELVGWEYDSPLLDKVPLQKEIAHRVVAADFVAMENTGMVHIAPGHGWDDYVLGTKEKLAIVCPVDGAGKFRPEAGIFAGKFVRDANQDVLDALGEQLLATEKITHRYGHCWRCKTPIIFRATSQWFLKASEIRDLMLSEVKKSRGIPNGPAAPGSTTGSRRPGDWCISRQRYWGIPIPVWVCDKCDKYRVIGTIAELEKASGEKVPDPHRPFVDKVTIPCECGGTMKRVDDIFDVWFDSAVASWATVGFPAKHRSSKNSGPRTLSPKDRTRPGAGSTRSSARARLRLGKLRTRASACTALRSMPMAARCQRVSGTCRSRGSDRKSRRGCAPALRALVIRTVGRLKVQLGRGLDRQPDGKHPLERVPFPDAVHDPRQVRAGGKGREVGRNVRPLPPPRAPGRGPVDYLPHQHGCGDRGCSDKGMPAPPGNKGDPQLHSRRPLALVRPAGPAPDVASKANRKRRSLPTRRSTT